MQTLDELFPNKWLKAVDFAEGEEKTLTIKAWSLSKVKGKDGKEQDLIDLEFIETSKILGAIKTNREAIAKLLGTRSPDEWIGKKVTFITMYVDSFGETVRAVRVKPSAPQAKTDALADKIAIFKDLRAKIHAAGGNMPAKETVNISTEAQLDQAIAEHKNLLAEALAKGLPY